MVLKAPDTLMAWKYSPELVLGEAQAVVDSHNVASAYGSGSTTFLPPLDDRAHGKRRPRGVDQDLPQGSISVGTRVDVRHTAATPIGLRSPHAPS